MNQPTSINHLSTYDQTIVELVQSPNSPEIQHRAILALARAGSLGFAVAEYERYGLGEIKVHSDPKVFEDILALGGRLQKDLYLSASGAEAKEHALQSAEKYETAFKLTGGYYSGINAATMALLANMPEAMVIDRAKTILKQLPPPDHPDKETLYFIEATRAEAHLLLGAAGDGQKALRTALDHDPLNYTAHASTLKQFKLILEYRGESIDWLTTYQPPRAAHFAGHMFKTGAKTDFGILDTPTIDKLRLQISDTLQRHDIGFGYGALAAGSDILIAEALLEEGCDLYVVLPIAQDLFAKHSVDPYGKDWRKRFEACLAHASSIDIASRSTDWPAADIDSYARRIAMGKAVMQSETLSVAPTQLLIWDQVIANSGTARGGAKWKSSGRDRIILPYPGPRRVRKDAGSAPQDLSVCAILSRADESTSQQYSSVYEAALAALALQKTNGHKFRLGLHIGIDPDDNDISDTSQRLAEQAVPGGILISEAAVNFLLLGHQHEFSMQYLGLADGGVDSLRAFALSPRG